jgi:toxin YoeB
VPVRDLKFEQHAFDDFMHWYEVDAKLAKRVALCIKEAQRDPFKGLHKPEPLKRMGPNVWSRRINDEHRLVYRVEHDVIVVLSVRGHYDD